VSVTESQLIVWIFLSSCCGSVKGERELRVLVRLRAQETFPYELGYHHDFQGFIYGLLRGTSYQSLHDKKRYKFFCFSNLIPPTRAISRGSQKTWMISSPEEAFIKTIEETLTTHEGQSIRLGRMAFKVEQVELRKVALLSSAFEEMVLSSGTPIVVRIPPYRWKEYGIQPRKGYRFVYWRKEYTPTAFIKQLEDNITKKYSEYFSAEEQPSLPLFEKLKFRKQVAVPLRMKGEESTVIGTLWAFHFRSMDEARHRMLQFGLDAGFGEMNSLGFGFMNLVKRDARGVEIV